MAESWTPKDDYSPSNHNHDNAYAAKSHNHDTVYSKLSHLHDDKYSKLGHTHDERYYTGTEVDAKLKALKDEIIEAGIDMLPIGTIMWFKQSVTLSNKWQVYEPLIGRYPLGATSGLGDTVEAGLPNIKGTFIAQTPMDGSSTGYSGAFTPDMNGYSHINDYGSGPYSRDITFDASSSSGVYKDGVTTVTPPSVKLIPYVKIA